MAKDLTTTLCPKCGIRFLTPVSERTGGFSGGKALVGAIIAGPIGLAAGALEKKKTTYRCEHCNYMVEV